MKKRIGFFVFLFLLCCFIVNASASESTSLGDADGNGEASAEDARLVLRVAVGLDEPGERTARMDVDGDGDITASDARLVLRYVVGLEYLFPAEIPAEIYAEEDVLQTDVDAPRALVYSVEENRILYRKNIDEQTASASLIKLLTAITALKMCSVNQVFTVGDEIDLIAWDSSVCGLEKGWNISLRDLLYGMLLPSGNDAAYCIAANVAMLETQDPSPENNVLYFVEKMNETAAALGMSNTVVKTPDGYDEAGQFTTARDLLTLARAALLNEQIAGICSCPSYKFSLPDGDSFTWSNTNRFLTPEHRYYDARVNGLKGGFTDDAGPCLIITSKVNGADYIIIVMGVDSFNDRYIVGGLLMDELENR